MHVIKFHLDLLCLCNVQIWISCQDSAKRVLGPDQEQRRKIAINLSVFLTCDLGPLALT